MSKYIGQIIQSKNYGRFEVLGYGSTRRRFNVRFLDTGYETEVSFSSMRTGEVKDYLAPSFYGIGIFGYKEAVEERFRHRRSQDLYTTWANMILRCYKEEEIGYKYYGARGVRVCERWKRFDYFVEDVQKIDGWENKLNDWGSYSLDKDKLGGDSLIYSPDTCCWLNDSEQAENSRACKFFYAKSPEGIVYFQNNASSFAEEQNLSASCVRACLRGEYKSHNGWKLSYEPF